MSAERVHDSGTGDREWYCLPQDVDIKSLHHFIDAGFCWRRERDLNSRGNGPTRFPVARTTRLCDLGSNLPDPHSSFNHHPLESTSVTKKAKGLKGATSTVGPWARKRVLRPDLKRPVRPFRFAWWTSPWPSLSPTIFRWPIPSTPFAKNWSFNGNC